ncbi:hypothetical protein VTN77DRAFT_2731 [Rasamsonia byssochlamydoides]|uniref:uncharacterized protein n=1 Tax=Rasamsonia byssochlamydoides TaxID=89139 RepID=UPI003744373E
MFPSQAVDIDIEALSGILGSISIACWVVVFSPQIIENFRRGSADGLSLLFIIVWLAGDVFNILGAVLQGVLPTMIILAVYYTLADIVLLGQCFYYRGFTLSDQVATKKVRPGSGYSDFSAENGEGYQPTERTALLSNGNGNGNGHIHTTASSQRISSGDLQPHQRSHHVDGTHLSPATPFVDPLPPSSSTAGVGSARPARRLSTLQTVLFNTFAIALVCAAGVLGWYVSSGGSHRKDAKKPEPDHDPLSFDVLGQVFGYLCAVLYLGSRLPQLLLNFRRKSTEGVSLLFFLFACIGNLTYVLSIFAYSPVCGAREQEQVELLVSKKPAPRCQPGEAAALYGRYILVNLSWLLGSLGTLLLDMAIFVQFFLYRKDDNDDSGDDTEEEEEYERR